jgi:uncharacterized protein (TIGR02145 family)
MYICIKTILCRIAVFTALMMAQIVLGQKSGVDTMFNVDSVKTTIRQDVSSETVRWDEPNNVNNKDIFIDPRDGKRYKIVRIRNQSWMAQNLNFKSSNSGCYKDDEYFCQKYGRLYNWNAAKSACPAGWRLPRDIDWEEWVLIAGDEEIAGKKLKSKKGWHDNETDDFGFSALPGGQRNLNGSFIGAGISNGTIAGSWWSSTEEKADYAHGWRIGLGYEGLVDRSKFESMSMDSYHKGLWFSVRCIQNALGGSVCRDESSNTSSTSNIGTFADSRDSKNYRTVKINNQTWMAENLNVEIGKSWCYNNDESNCKKYGRLYDWNTSKVACPDGWHLPNRSEWNDLINTAGCSVAGKKLKSKTGWNKNGNGTDILKFSAIPGGYRFWGINDSFGDVGSIGYWWSSSEFGSKNAYYLSMDYDSARVSEQLYNKNVGFSVRCVLN